MFPGTVDNSLGEWRYALSRAPSIIHHVVKMLEKCDFVRYLMTDFSRALIAGGFITAELRGIIIAMFRKTVIIVVYISLCRQKR